MAVPDGGPVHVPRAPVRVHRARLAGLLRGARDGARAHASRPRPSWLLGLVPLAADRARPIGLFAALGAPGLGDRRGPPAEELAVERTVLEPGVIELTVRNDGPDAVTVAQAVVNDAFAQFSGADEPIGRLGTATVRIAAALGGGRGLRGRAADLDRRDDRARDPGRRRDARRPALSFFGLLALLGIYVGVIPVALGMLWLPWVRRIPPGWLRAGDGADDRPAGVPGRRRDARGLRAGRRGLAGVRRRRARAGRRGGRLPGADAACPRG